MGRSGSIAIGATIGGIGVAIALAITVPRENSKAPQAPPPPVVVRPPSAQGQHCRTVSDADTQCAAFWEERRNHFFGTGRRP